MRLITCPFALVLGCAVSLDAQTAGEITGEVRDASGAIVVGVEVKATNKGTGAVRNAVTNDAGLYTFPSLQPALYDVSVAKAGFQTMTRSNLELQVQQTARVDFVLQVGQATQLVEVTADAPLLTTENATVGAVIENKRIVELPLNGRNFLQLVSLAPNVSFGFANSRGAGIRFGGHRSEQNISVSGQRSEWNHFTLDGVENTDPTYNLYVFLPSIDALQEFKVQTGVYPAEFGRAIGQVNVSTKSGTNDFHGAVWEFLRNDKLDAKNYAFDQGRPPKDPFKWNQYGFTVGGPVWIPKVFNGRNRLFFLSNFEGYRDRRQLRGLYNVPYMAMRAGDFTGLPAIFDPTTRVRSGNQITATPFPANRIPLTMINPKAMQLLEFLPEPNVNTGSFVNNRQQGNRRVIDRDQFNQRIDFVESANSNWFGRYSWGDENQLLPTIKDTGSKIGTQPRQQMISNTRVFSPTMVNEFRVSHTGLANALTTPLARIRDVNRELAIRGFPSPPPDAWGVPSVSINTFSAFGDLAQGPYINNNHIFQWVDNFSWIKGKHSLRFGVEIRRDRFNTTGNSDPRGTLGFTGHATENPALSLGNSAGTGTAMADFLLGYNRTASISEGLGVSQFRATSQAYYIDDTWKILPGLTLSLGLRYENTPPWLDQLQNYSNIAWPAVRVPPGVVNPADRSLHPTLVRIGNGDFYEGLPLRFDPAINVARDGRLGPRGVYRDNNDFAPRLGIAWSPTDRWTIRSGAGVFYVQEISSLKFDGSRNLAGPRGAQSDNSFPNLTLNNPFQDLSPIVRVDFPQLLGQKVDRRTAYSTQFLFNVQRQLSSQTALEVGYLGSLGRKLESWVGINEPLPSAVGSPQSRFPFPELRSSYIMEGNGKSNYHSLGAKLQHRLSQGMNLMASYTWSKSIDMSSGARNHVSEEQFPQNSYCLQCERGLSAFHASHRFVASTLYELPLGTGKRFLNGGGTTNVLFGGWQLSSIVTLQTGFPVTVLAGFDVSNRAHGPDRPNATGQKVAFPRGHQDPMRFFNTNAFTWPQVGTLGNVGRNVLIGPGIIGWDFSTIKNFQVRENQQLQFRFEAFNLPNHPNWGLPNTMLTSPNFGRITTTSTDMRDLQLGLKYLF